MSSTHASITSASSERRASRPIDSAITRIASAGSMKQSIMPATIGAAPDGKGAPDAATPGTTAGRSPSPTTSTLARAKALPCFLPSTSRSQTGNGPLRYGRAVLADDAWFLVLAGVTLGALVLASARYRALAARTRRAALERRLVEAGPGRRID